MYNTFNLKISNLLKHRKLLDKKFERCMDAEGAKEDDAGWMFHVLN